MMRNRHDFGSSSMRWARSAIALSALTATTASLALNGDEHSMRQAIGQAGQAIQGEVLKGAAAQKAVMEGLATYRAQSRLQDKAITLQQTLKQSDQLCQTMDTQEALAAGVAKARARVAVDQRKSLYPISRNLNSIATVDAMHKASNESFCSEDEVKLGVCKATSNPKFNNLAGADQDAMYLFQSRSGSHTYEGTRDGGQVTAVDAYIARVVSGGVPPELLKVQGSSYEKNPQARAYVEMSRRYQAFLSMAAYSLHSIKGARTPAQ